MAFSRFMASSAIIPSVLGQDTSSSVSSCSNTLFELPYLPGTKAFSILAEPVKALDIQVSKPHSAAEPNVTIDFCNITISYGHRGWKDSIDVYVWLPLNNWNERLVGVGGGGFAGLYSFGRMAGPVSLGYAAVATNTGHEMNVLSADNWALDEAGNVNFFLLQNFFSTALNEAAIIGKSVVKDAYGRDPKFSYWDGCSTGGRQGLMLAQRYPTAYDGIVAGAPAVHWASFIPPMVHPQIIMRQQDHYPSQCIFAGLTAAAVEACDGLDGVQDGIMSLPSQCDFSPDAVVGTNVSCGSHTETITSEDADVARLIWDGPKKRDGSSLWFSLPLDTSFKDIAGFICNNGQCVGEPHEIVSSWIKNFVIQDLDFDFDTLTPEGLEALTHLSVAAYESVASTNNPDLKDFREAGGKLLHWHGTADQQIFSPGSELYYKNVESRDPALRDFYRYFEAPGVGHCAGGFGLLPDDPFASLVDWVEHGIAPETLPATSTDGKQKRNLCQYPLVPVYQGGDSELDSSFQCKESFVR